MGKKTKFWLPNYTPMHLLRTPHIHMLGSTFPGEKGDLQWFETFAVTRPDGRNLVKVCIKRNARLNRSAALPGLFETLDITLLDAPAPMRAIRAPTYGSRGGAVAWKDYGVGGGTVQFRIGRQPHEPPRIYGKYFEYLYVQTPDITFAICPAHAAVEYPSDPRKALKYSHLDLFIFEMHDASIFTGILPELWGVIPLSEEVKALTVSPVPKENATRPDRSNPQDVASFADLVKPGWQWPGTLASL